MFKPYQPDLKYYKNMFYNKGEWSYNNPIEYCRIYQSYYYVSDVRYHNNKLIYILYDYRKTRKFYYVIMPLRFDAYSNPLFIIAKWDSIKSRSKVCNDETQFAIIDKNISDWWYKYYQWHNLKFVWAYNWIIPVTFLSKWCAETFDGYNRHISINKLWWDIYDTVSKHVNLSDWNTIIIDIYYQHAFQSWARLTLRWCTDEYFVTNGSWIAYKKKYWTSLDNTSKKDYILIDDWTWFYIPKMYTPIWNLSVY